MAKSNKQAAAKTTSALAEWRRHALGCIGLMMLGAALTVYLTSSGSGSNFASAAMARVGAVLIALWIAWPSLKRPAQWLPAGAAIICLVALIVVATQPRLIIPAIPAVVLLITISGFVRAFRGSK